MSDVPNVNLFIGYVETLKGKSINSDYVKNFRDKRQFYGCNKDNDYVKYVSNGSKEVLDFVEYSGNNEKSHGIFNQNGLMKPEDVKILRKQLRDTESTIWHGVISFTEEFGNKYCNNYEKAYKMMKTELPKFLFNAGLNPKNIIWYAGLHENTDNKHIHFSFFEKAPMRYKQKCNHKVYSDGLLPQKAIDRAKTEIEIKLSGISNDIYTQRKTLTEKIKKNLELGEYMNKVKTLLFVLPFEGRMSYDSENMRIYKPQIDTIVNSIIRADKDLKKKFTTFESLLAKRDNEVKIAYSKIDVDYSKYLVRDKVIEDIYRRLGNLVLYTVKDIRNEQKKIEYETKSRLALKRIEKNKQKILLRRCMQLNDMVNREIINSFQDYLDRLEEANYKRLKEEGYLD